MAEKKKKEWLKYFPNLPENDKAAGNLMNLTHKKTQETEWWGQLQNNMNVLNATKPYKGTSQSKCLKSVIENILKTTPPK